MEKIDTDIQIVENELLTLKIPTECIESKCCIKGESDQFLSKIKQLCEENGIYKVLLTSCSTCALAPNMWSQFTLGENISKIFSDNNIKFGIYGKCTSYGLFTESVQLNNNSMVKISDDREDILQWFDQ